MTDDHPAGPSGRHLGRYGPDGGGPGEAVPGSGPAPTSSPNGPHASEAAGGRPACRPRSTDPAELGFTPRKPVPWLAPFLLVSTGIRTLLALLFGAYLDKRELQTAFDAKISRQVGPDGGLWLDYVADLGDGFDATYSVAYLLAQRELMVEGHRLPRAQVLVMGGDQVYPSAAFDTYEDRCKGPYQAALPVTPPEQPTLFAIPGNHDWYDGLTAFLRLFVRSRDRHFGGWNTEQSRSYFAVELPADWWLFGLDDQSGSYLDDPQLTYFDDVAERLGPQSRVILAVPMPTWVKATKHPTAYDSIDYFIRTIVAPTGARVRLLISGDLHHYARYAGPDRQLITCGGGGAYLYPTHLLPERIQVPPKETLARRASATQVYELAGRYPDAARSRRYAWGAFLRLPLRNPGFTTLLGALYALLVLAMVGVCTNRDDAQLRLFSVPLAAMLLVTLLGAFFFAKPPGSAGKRRLRHWLLGVGHGLAHVALAAGGTWVWLALPFHDWPWPLSVVAAVVFFGSVGGLAASQLVAAYLLVAGAFGVNVNELFAGQGIEDAKGFLRMHIAPEGTLTIYPIGLDRVGRHWQVNPDLSAESSWLVPGIPLEPRLAEPPVVLR
ncbi:metallophosphoesterase family protein [Salinispora arenicola]|uniref:metallophosphoesterase family protein n=1 Tax=Salinispora arenicola TaxID=168697 RepID=UPI0016AC806E|nr:metallophosphoesterase [Salinispora arenicola]NIL59899.1 cytochrome d ubiquinol oxidase subunit II [Salinispora arenicola]NIL63168.1 cytochrome d ubiquinol oxidase subunit II [Salinispora arenicola]